MKKKYFAKVSIFLMCLFITHYILVFILVNDSGSYTRIMMHEMYTQDENIDVLFLGASHCYRSINPEVTDKLFGQNTFNAGSSSQQLDGSFALLKEVAKTNDLKQVYVEITYLIMGEINEERTDLTSTYLLSDYMRPSLNKWSFLYNASNSKHYINGLLRERRYSLDIIATIKAKLSGEYRNFNYIDNGIEYYAGKGFVYSREFIENGTFCSTDNFAKIEDSTLSKDNIKYLREIISYCKSNNIKLTFFTAPMSDFRLVNVGNYDSYVNQIEGLLVGSNVEYYDFNLCKENQFKLMDEYFKDDNHLNGAGADVFSSVFSRFFTGKISEDELFWNSYAEKIKNITNKVLGVVVKRIDSQNRYEIIPVTTSQMDLFYSVTMLDLYGNEVVCEKSKNNYFDIETSNTDKFIVSVYADETKEITNQVTVQLR